MFMCIYKLGFVQLYGALTCSRNRLCLLDEDHSSYGPMENLIATSPEFKDSMVALCIFHGLWQPFKESVFPTLPKKSPKSKELSDVGEEWGEYI